MTRQVLIRAELLEGRDNFGNARVMIPYAPGEEGNHARIRMVDPAMVVDSPEGDASRTWDRAALIRMADALVVQAAILRRLAL